jgi:glycosyltransferase involved in cell wall biosynthesis
MKSKILVISEAWGSGGGGEISSYLITELLDELGFEIIIVHGSKVSVFPPHIRHIYTDMLNVKHKYLLWINCSILANEKWFINLVKESDVIFITKYCYPLIPAFKKFGKKVIVRLCDLQLLSHAAVVFNNNVMEKSNFITDAIRTELYQHKSLLRAAGAGFVAPLSNLSRLWVRDADIIICPSRKQAEMISEKYPDLVNKIKVIPSPLPRVSLIKRFLQEPVFLYLGGDSYIKGFDVFLNASWHILKDYSKVKFVLAGEYGKHSIRTLNNLNKLLNNRYVVLGKLPYNDVLGLYRNGYALIFPSLVEEPLPRVVIESMLMGVVPIASRVGGVPEIVEGTFAEEMLFSPGDSKELVDRMKLILDMPKEHLLDIGQKLRDTILKKFEIKKIKAELLKVFS